MINETKLKAEWDNDGNLRAEFQNNFDIYLAFRKNEEAGNIHILVGTVQRGILG
jgi:hypothetical protein